MHSSDRRFLLKSLAAAGLAVTSAGWAQLAQARDPAPAGLAAQLPAQDSDDVLVLTSGLSASALDAALHTAFLAGVRSATTSLTHADLQGLDSAPIAQLGERLGDGRSTLLVGLLDDASATLVLDVVRSAGGRVLLEQQHRIAGSATAWAHDLGQALALGQPSSDNTPAAAGAPARVSFRCLI